MQQVKIFKATDTELDDLENQVNRWIRKSGVRILSINGNLTSQNQSSDMTSTFAAGDVLLVILYEEDQPPA